MTATPHLPSPEEIEAAKTMGGAWRRETLAKWGIDWPPPKGWRNKLHDEWWHKIGRPAAERGLDATERDPGANTEALLRRLGEQMGELDATQAVLNRRLASIHQRFERMQQRQANGQTRT